MADKVKVLYIAGSGRSGSTILDNILGEVPGFFSAGELYYVWERSMLENRSCGCGVPFNECPLWQKVFEDAFGRMGEVDAARLASLTASVRSRNTPLALVPPLRKRGLHRLSDLVEHTDSLYRSIAGVTGADVIVDSSKVLIYGRLLAEMESIDLTVVHLVRDPRAVAYSWMRKKEHGDPATRTYMTTHSASRSALNWVTWNASIRPLFGSRALVMRYEDFMADPLHEIKRVLEALGESDQDLSFLTPHGVQLHPNHTVSGNPSRFDTGMVKLRLDDRWRREMGAGPRRTVTALSLPWLRRYRYPIRTKGR